MSIQRIRLTTEQSEEVKQIVLSCILANRTVNETIDIIDRRLNVKLAIDTIKHLRMKVRKESLDDLQIMKSDNDSYLYEYLKNMEQTKKVIKETWNLADLALQKKDYELWRKCLNDIMNYTVLLNRFHDFLPAICSMKLFDSELVPNTNTMGKPLQTIAE
jgi:transcriptional regulator of heat shock response